MTEEKHTTLADAKAAFIASVSEGAICPCCGRSAKINRITITSIHAKFLEWLQAHTTRNLPYKGWVAIQYDAPSWVIRSNSHSKLLMWGLIERKPTEDGRDNSGVYRLSEKGRRFLDGAISVKKTMLVYNNISLFPEGIGEDVTFLDCLGKQREAAEV